MVPGLGDTVQADFRSSEIGVTQTIQSKDQVTESDVFESNLELLFVDDNKSERNKIIQNLEKVKTCLDVMERQAKGAFLGY